MDYESRSEGQRGVPDHQPLIFSGLKRLGDAVGRRGGLGEFVQGQLFELSGGEARADFAAGGAFGFQFLPEPQHGILEIHRPHGFLPSF